MQKETPKPKHQKRKPLGPELDWTDKDLDSLAEISDADLLEAAALWENEAPAPFQRLLKAKVEEKPGNA